MPMSYAVEDVTTVLLIIKYYVSLRISHSKTVGKLTENNRACNQINRLNVEQQTRKAERSKGHIFCVSRALVYLY